jgi:hypothetical protein
MPMLVFANFVSSKTRRIRQPPGLHLDSSRAQIRGRAHSLTGCVLDALKRATIA